ncbi:Ig-like domain-containing protein [Archangium primigenium]|uniref:Ig-like domain-containing protein n=1 Tax=[Archangium] primigenium TaxID=2792470 RepID=UPI001956A453|nr:PKD domain-containing protein [Archangium primigenium]MBM7118848.1 PKD domain-containing protein [Archangium primigenium]
MCSLNGSGRAVSLALLLAVGLIAGCEGPPGTTSADIQVHVSQELTDAGITRVRVEVSGPGISPVITTELAQAGDSWRGRIASVPHGQDRLFRATAQDAAGTTLYTGAVGPLTLEPGTTPNVVILMQRASPEAPFENEAPRITSLVLSANPVAPEGLLTVTAQVSDANAGDTLRYAWTAGAGTFGSPQALTSTWKAPTTEGPQSLTFTVTDSKGASATLSLEVSVARPGSGAETSVSARINHWPSIQAMNGTPSLLRPGTTTRLSATVTDADGDMLVGTWTSGCQGVFNDTTATSATFTLHELPASGRCPISLAVQDTRGGHHAGTLWLHVDATVRGKRDWRHVHGNGPATRVADDLSTREIGAWVPTPDGTGYTWSAGQGASDGTFSIPQVPGGFFLVRFGDQYLWTDQRRLDFSEPKLGRADLTLEEEPFPITLELAGLSPWRPGDDLRLYAPGAGVGFAGLQACSFEDFGWPAEGATTFSGGADFPTFMESCGLRPPRFDARDTLYLDQLVARTEPGTGLLYQELRRSTRVQGPVRAPGAPLQVQGTLVPLPLIERDLIFRASLFEPLALAAHPSATLSGQVATLGLQADAHDTGIANTGWPDIASAETPSRRGDFTAHFQYGNPYPSTWTPFAYTLVGARVAYTLELPGGGTTSPVNVTTSLAVREALPATGPLTIQPRVGPAQNLALNGVSATGRRTDVGFTPLVSWTPHAIDTTTHYQVRLQRFVFFGTYAYREHVATLSTSATQVRLPPGLLVAGERYLLQVVSTFAPAKDANNPFDDSLVRYTASALSGVFSP